MELLKALAFGQVYERNICNCTIFLPYIFDMESFWTRFRWKVFVFHFKKDIVHKFGWEGAKFHATAGLHNEVNVRNFGFLIIPPSNFDSIAGFCALFSVSMI